MQLQPATRKNAKIRVALQGPSGSGKTFSSLLLAYGLCNDWTKIAVIDTEHHSADLYAHLGAYYVVSLEAPFSPERYIEAISFCEKSGMEVIILDGISQQWEFLLSYHHSLPGNSFINWGKVTPRHNAFVNTILHSTAHIIATIRTKQDYILTEKNGKQVPEKVGLRAIQRNGLDYEFTLVFDLNMKNQAVCSKDRTSLFMGKPDFKITKGIGEQILHWCNLGQSVPQGMEITGKIEQCSSVTELARLFHTLTPDNQIDYQLQFSEKRRLLETAQGYSIIQHTGN